MPASPNVPFTAPVFTKDDFARDGLPEFNNFATALSQRINYLSGNSGPIKLNNSIDLNGNSVTNAQTPLTPDGVITLDYAQQQFGAAAIKPQIEALGKTVLQTTRRLSDQIQRENYSSFLNSVLNTAPTGNTATLSATTVGSSVDVAVSAGMLQHLDGSQIPFASRTDALPLPTLYTITSLSRVGGVVTATLGSAFGGSVGELIQVTGNIAAEWQGNFIVGSPIAGNVIVYAQSGANDSESGGVLSLVTAYYYTISKGQNKLGLVTVNGADTWSNRVHGSFDQTTIVAVVILTGVGIDPLNSAAGASIPVSGASIPVIRRL